VGQAYAEYILQQAGGSGVAVGFDGRRQSQEFARIIAGVLEANGIEVTLSDRIIPTPVLSFTVRFRGLAGGVMITASHNPPEDNGVKFKGPYGGPLMTEETRAIERLIGQSAVRTALSAPKPTDMLTPYLNRLEQLIDLKSLRDLAPSAAVDSMAGAGGGILSSFLGRLGLRVVPVDNTPLPDFRGRLPEPIEANLAPLAAVLAKDPTLVLGLATDGDADRCGVMLEGGAWLSAQETILLLTDHLLRARKEEGDVVKTSSVTDKVKRLAEGEGRVVHDVQVGFKHIAEKMIRGPVAIGCEESGGFGYGIHIPERDGILSCLLMLELLAQTGSRSLAKARKAITERFGAIHYRRIDVTYERSDRTNLLPTLLHEIPSSIGGLAVGRLAQFESSRGIVNGLKFILEGDDRWLLIRSSETEPMIRLYAEGQDDTEVETLLSAARSLLALP
jgi:phosphomannomutase